MLITKPLFLCFFLILLPYVFGNVGFGRKVRLITREVGIENNSGETYVVVFDAGSSGTRVHVFRFDDGLDLLQIDGQLEIYAKVSPGLSSYAENPEKAASSIVPLLQKAVNVVPGDLRYRSPVILGATAGLRLVGEEKSENILQAVRSLLANSSLLYKKDWIAVISGTQEGTYMWVAMNYLLGNLGNDYSKTVGVIDLGGASVQMAYAISTQAAANAPETGEEYITKHYLKGRDYNLYVHSYLRYGLDAARAEVLKLTNDSVNYCVLSGYTGTYKYDGALYNMVAPSSGSDFEKCREHVVEALNITAKCEVRNCTFNGVWNGGGGAGQDKLYLASAFVYTAADDNIVDRKAGSIEMTLADFRAATVAACSLRSPEEARAKYPKAWTSNLPFICFDLAYQYTLLTDGFGLKDEKKVTLVDKVNYGDFKVEATWPLGNAIEIASGMPSTTMEAKNMYRFWSYVYEQ